MSGSFEKDARWAAQRGARVTTQPAASPYDDFDVPPTQTRTSDAYDPSRYSGDFLPDEPTIQAPPTPGKKKRKQGGPKAHELMNAAIVPPGSVTGRSLTLVISIMCFLACLTAGAVFMIHQSAEAWLKDIASEVTVQVEPPDQGDAEKLVSDVSAFLTKERGITGVKALSVEDSAQLLEPWLGSIDTLKALPVPRLIALELDRAEPPDLEAVRASLTGQFQGVTLDDHRGWQRQIRTVTHGFALGGLGILLLVASATTAVIVSATRSALSSNREIVEVLHFVGATDRFIAREFERHFLSLGIRAGLVGALCAMATFLVLPTVLGLVSGGAVTMAELQRLVGTGSLDLPGYILLGIVVIVIAALCMLTSRFGVYRILNSKQ
jgi:cell division transport system permease protein